MIRRVKRAATISGLGLVVQLAAAVHWTPATFILSAVIGAPLVLAGSVIFLAAVWGNLKDRGAA